MANLDDISAIKKLDSKNLSGSILALSDQIRQVAKEKDKITIPDAYKSVSNIVVAGMGGSALGPEIIRHLFADRIKVPITIVRDYFLPAFVDQNTLLILSSYSGNTEETLTAGQEGLKRGAKIVGIASGGKLEEFLKANNLPGYIFQPCFNPSGQPRIGLGYSIFGILAILTQAGLLDISDSEIEAVIQTIKLANDKFNLEVSKFENLAKKMAEKIQDKIPIVVGAEFLAGNVHTIANQINENAKTLSTWFLLPEANHHLFEGLANPESNSKNLIFLFLNSNLYSSKIQKRVEITKEIIGKNSIEFLEFKPESGSKIEQSFEVLVFGSWLSFYLAILNNLDPTLIPWVDYLKGRLS
jgi:glucose/mannose-6-phosphate isomerase